MEYTGRKISASLGYLTESGEEKKARAWGGETRISLPPTLKSADGKQSATKVEYFLHILW